MKCFNKLVRDNVPKLILQEGQRCEYHYARKKDFIPLIEAKLIEEVDEYTKNRSLEELADICEMVYVLAEALDYSEKDIKEAIDNKRKQRGGFKHMIVIEKVYDLNE